MRIILQIVLFSFLIVSCDKERYQYDIKDFRKEIRPALKSLSKEESLPVKDTLARNFIELNASKEELVKLMEFKKPLIRVLAYSTIVNRQEPDYYELLLNHLSDTARVHWWVFDDVIEFKQVSDLMIRKAHAQKGLSPIQKKHLVEKVLLENSYLDISTWMIQDVEPNELYYDLLKLRTKTKGKYCGEQLSACFALSKFKKVEDVNLLYEIFKENLVEGNCMMWIFRSIEKFPNEKFYPLLENYFEKNIKNKLTSNKNINDDVLYFVRAVAAYRNEKALAILRYVEQNNTFINKPYWPPYNKQYVYKAILINYDPIFDDLKNHLKKEFNEDDINRFIRLDLLEYKEIPNW